MWDVNQNCSVEADLLYMDLYTDRMMFAFLFIS